MSLGQVIEMVEVYTQQKEPTSVESELYIGVITRKCLHIEL